MGSARRCGGCRRAVEPVLRAGERVDDRGRSGVRSRWCCAARGGRPVVGGAAQADRLRRHRRRRHRCRAGQRCDRPSRPTDTATHRRLRGARRTRLRRAVRRPRPRRLVVGSLATRRRPLCIGAVARAAVLADAGSGRHAPIDAALRRHRRRARHGRQRAVPRSHARRSAVGRCRDRLALPGEHGAPRVPHRS